MGIFNKLFSKSNKTTQIPPAQPPKVIPKPPEVVPKELKSEKHHVAGITSYIDNIMKLAVENPDYPMSKKEIIDNFMDGERIYQYEFFPSKIELIEEPTNAFDPNAIMVKIDDLHVGYIKKGSCSHIKKLLTNNSIKILDANIVGGNYKVVYESNNQPSGYELIKDKSNYGIILEITLN